MTPRASLPVFVSVALALAGCPGQKSGPTKVELKASWVAAEDELQGRLKAVSSRLESMAGRPEAVELLRALDGAQNEFHKTRVTVTGELDALPMLTEESLQPLTARLVSAQRRFEVRLASAESLATTVDDATKKPSPADESAPASAERDTGN
jgi:hypothetical protein